MSRLIFFTRSWKGKASKRKRPSIRRILVSEHVGLVAAVGLELIGRVDNTEVVANRKRLKRYKRHFAIRLAQN